jgi:hypothetical protein
MVMLNNKLCLTSVVEFLRRGRVNRGTGGGKLVVVVDSSKRKVTLATLWRAHGRGLGVDGRRDFGVVVS